MTTTRMQLVDLNRMLQSLARQRRCCDTCQHWYGHPIVCCDLDGNETGRTEPPVCPTCGREIPQGREQHLIGIRLEDLP